MLAFMLIVPPVAAVIAQAASTAAPAAPAPPATEAGDAAVTARAKDWFHQIQAGKIDRSQLDDKMNAALTDSTVAQVSTQIAPLGNPSAFTLSKKITQGSVTAYVFAVQFPSITLYETFALDPDGKIAGLLLRPQNPSP
jgi:D-alanyl-D-alanine carboxypeptidase